MVSGQQYAAVPVDESMPAASIPLPPSSTSLAEFRPPFHTIGASESPRDSYAASTAAGSAAPLGGNRESSFLIEGKDNDEKEAISSPPPGIGGSTTRLQQSKKRRCTPLVAIVALIALVVIILAVILPIVFVVIKPRQNKTSTSSSNNGHGTPTSSGSGTSPTSKVEEAISGGDGSTVKASDGSTFQYKNQFSGIWWSDPNDPFNNNAFPNSWTPPLNQSWDYGNNRIYGVNLGGWFVLEPFISPALFQKYPGAVDEWTLSTLMAADTANGGLNQLEDHYKTFITEQDIAQIAGAGLNWVRIPIPYWAIDTWGDEPFLAKTSWKYILQAIEWCRKYGIRVKLDLHTIPGSQNGFNHSGKLGSINFLNGVMGMANAQRALNYIRIITEFISQPEYKDVVPMFGIMNEALISHIGKRQMGGFYVQAYEMIRGITGIGTGKGPFISIHDGFQGIQSWAGFLAGADRLALDTHPYFAFDGSTALDPIDTGVGADAGGPWPQRACTRWAASMNTSRTGFGVTFAGEFSNGFNDCGLFLKGIPGSHTYGGNCDVWQDSSNWTPGTKAGLMAFASASMDAFRDWFFWTWKIGNSNAGIVQSPLWSYQLGLENGWMPTDPRSAIGACGAAAGPVWDGTFEDFMTGSGAGTIAPDQLSSFVWPPPTLAEPAVPATSLPVYTSTGSIATLPMPTFTDAAGKAIDSKANGWFNQNDNTPGPTPIPGCTYPDAWDAVDVSIPDGCTGGANAAIVPSITPPPRK